MLESYGITLRFNVIKKRTEVHIPGHAFDQRNRDENSLAHLESLLCRNDMSMATAGKYLTAVADKTTYDPFAEWVESKPWDGTSRLDAICGTIQLQEGYSRAVANVLITKWLLSIVAASYKKGFKARGVLTFQGPQGIGKTSWIMALVTPPDLRSEIVKGGYSWDAGNKDARLAAIRHRIVELGELETSFRKELGSLKAFITEEYDKIRPPYGRVEAEYPRSTVFAASVNDSNFLQDRTGNSRFWTIEAQSIDYQHDVDMQQVFAELKTRFDKGAEWWLNQHEEAALESINSRHCVRSAVEEKLAEAIDLEIEDRSGFKRMTANQVLERLGYEKPSNQQSKEANAALRHLLGEGKSSGGVKWWRVPWRTEDEFICPDDDPANQY